MTVILQTANYIIRRAYRHATLITQGAVPNSTQLSDGLDGLNNIVNLWATQGLKLWLQEEITVPLFATKYQYSLGPSGDVNMDKPLQVLQAYYQFTSGTRQPLTPLSRDEWTRLAQINVGGAVNSYFADKQLSFIYLNFFNAPDTTAAANGSVVVVARVAPKNYLLTSDTAGFPPEWYIALEWALALELADGMPDAVIARCEKHAAAYRTALEGFDVEDAPTFFQPDYRARYSYGAFR